MTQSKAIKAVRVALGALLLSAVPALAQWDTQWNASGPHPTTCQFNSVVFYPNDEICVRPGYSQICVPDGTMTKPAPSSDCKEPAYATGAYSSTMAHEELTPCVIGYSRFTANAEICVAPGQKQVCGQDGKLSAVTPDDTCKASVVGRGR
jgi:hypothetical protein